MEHNHGFLSIYIARRESQKGSQINHTGVQVKNESPLKPRFSHYNGAAVEPKKSGLWNFCSALWEYAFA